MAEFIAFAELLGSFLAKWYVQAAILAASIYYQRDRAKKLADRAKSAAEEAKGFQISTEEPVSTIPVQYGRAKLGGTRVYHKTLPSYVYAAPGAGGDMFLSTGDSRGTSTPTTLNITRVQGQFYISFEVSPIVDSTFTATGTIAGNVLTFTAPPGLDPPGYPINTFFVNQDISVYYTEAPGGFLPYRIVSYDNSTGLFTLNLIDAQLAANTAALSANVTGTANEFLHVQQAICQAGIHKIYWCDVDEKSFNDEKFIHGHRIHTYNSGGIADPMHTANGGLATSVFTDTCYASMMFRLNREDPQYGTIPSVQFYVEGQEVYGITGSLGSRTLTGSKSYSNNPALCLLDYLLNSKYGKGLSLSEIDLESFYQASLLCGKVVQTAMPENGKLWTEKGKTADRDINLYECNLTIDTSKSIRDNIEVMLETMPGAELVWSGGKYKLQLNYPTEWDALATYAIGDVVQYPPGASSSVDLFVSTVGSNTATPIMGATSGPWIKASDAYITDDDLVREEQTSISYPSSQQRLNLCTVKYLNESEEFEEDTVTWPTRDSVLHNTFKTQDGEIPLESETFVSGCVDQYHALAAAEEKVRSSRSSVIYKFAALPGFADLEPGDIINVNSVVLAVPGELMKIEEVSLTDKGNTSIQAIKFDARQLAWNAKDDEIVANRNIYSGEVPQVTGLAFSPTSDQTYTVGVLSWVRANDARVNQYLIYYTLDMPASVSPDSEWIQIGLVSSLDQLRFEIPSLPTNTYTLTVVAGRSDGKFSPRLSYATGSRWPLLLVSLTESTSGIGASPTAFTLSNEAHTVPTDSLGNVLTFAGADTYISAMRGTTDETSLWTYTKVDTGVVSTLTGNHDVVTAFVGGGGGADTTVKLLLRGNETAGATVFDDASTFNKTAVNTSTNIVTTTSHAAYGNGILLPTTPDGRLYYADNADWHLGSGDFTIDFQFYYAAAPADNQIIMGQWSGYEHPMFANSWAVIVTPSNFIQFDYVSTDSVAINAYISSAALGLVPASINYVRITRSGVNLDIRVNSTVTNDVFASSGTTIWTPVISAPTEFVYGEYSKWNNAVDLGSPAYSNNDNTATFTSTASLDVTWSKYFRGSSNAYAEIEILSGSGNLSVGAVYGPTTGSGVPGVDDPRIAAQSLFYKRSGQLEGGTGDYTLTVPALAVNDVVMIALDYNGQTWMGLNGTWFNDPVVDGQNYNIVSGGPHYLAARSESGASGSANLLTMSHQFHYPVPVGFTSWSGF